MNTTHSKNLALASAHETSPGLGYVRTEMAEIGEMTPYNDNPLTDFEVISASAQPCHAR